MKIFKIISRILICLLIVIFLGVQYFGYSSKPVDDQDIQDTYHLNLTDQNWQYTKYNKKTIINSKPSFYQMVNPFITFNGYRVSIEVSEGNEIFETNIRNMLFKSHRNQVMIEKQISHHNVDMTVQILETESNDFELEYRACCTISFNYNDYLYRFSFNGDPTPLSYSINRKDIHEDELTSFLSIIDELFVYN